MNFLWRKSSLRKLSLNIRNKMSYFIQNRAFFKFVEKKIKLLKKNLKKNQFVEKNFKLLKKIFSCICIYLYIRKKHIKK